MTHFLCNIFLKLSFPNPGQLQVHAHASIQKLFSGHPLCCLYRAYYSIDNTVSGLTQIADIPE